MTPPRILQVEFPFGNPVYIAAACTVVPVTGEPIIVGATIVVRSVLPLPEDITYRAADTILTDPAFNRPRLAKESAGLTTAPRFDPHQRLRSFALVGLFCRSGSPMSRYVAARSWCAPERRHLKEAVDESGLFFSARSKRAPSTSRYRSPLRISH